MPAVGRIEMWAGPCRLGYPDRYDCPQCTPPRSLRCPEEFNGHPCLVLGKHDRHLDGAGTAWWLVDPDQLDLFGEVSA